MTDIPRFSASFEFIRSNITLIGEINPEKKEVDLKITRAPRPLEKKILSQHLGSFPLPREYENNPSKLSAWLEQMALAGLDIFRKKDELDRIGLPFHPAVDTIFQFVSCDDDAAFADYVRFLERQCYCNGMRDDKLYAAYLVDLLVIIFEIELEDLDECWEDPAYNSTDRWVEFYMKFDYNYSNILIEYGDVLDAILGTNPPLEPFLSHPRFSILLKHEFAVKIKGYEASFANPIGMIRRYVAECPESYRFDGYNRFFSEKTEPNYWIREIAASNRAAAAKYPDFRNFLSYTTEPSSNVRAKAVENPEAVHFLEFRGSFSKDTEPDSHVRSCAAKLRTATRFIEYSNFLEESTEPRHDVRVAAASNPLAPNFKEYERLFRDSHEWVRAAVARNKNAPIFGSFRTFFSPKTESSQHVREAAAENPNARIFPQLTSLMNPQFEPAFKVRLNAAKNVLNMAIPLTEDLLDSSVLSPKDYQVLKELEVFIKQPLPIIPYIAWTDLNEKQEKIALTIPVGVVVRNKYVLELSLQGLKLENLPPSVNNLEHLDVINLANNCFSKIPFNMNSFSYLRELNFSHNHLPVLSDQWQQPVFNPFNNLKRLDLSWNRLTSLPSSIKTLMNLEECDLSHNQIEEFPQNMEFWHSLKVLRIDNNELNHVPSSILIHWQKIRVLSLEANDISHLPIEIKQLPSLTELHLDGNPLLFSNCHTFLAESPAIFRFHGIPLFYLEVKALRDLEFAIGKTFEPAEHVLKWDWHKFGCSPNFGTRFSHRDYHVTELGLNNCSIRQLPDSISALTSLNILCIHMCPISELSSIITMLTNLTDLYLPHNELARLPENFGHLQHLEEFWLMDNKLETLPESITQIPTLKAIRANNNNIAHLPASMGDLKNLTVLALQTNKLQDLPEGIGGLSSLKVLNVDSNQIREIPASIGDLHDLEEINFSSNFIALIPDEIGHCQKLRWLSVGNNALENLPPSLAALPELLSLSFWKNKVASLPGEFEHINPKVGLSYEENPIATNPPEWLKKRGQKKTHECFF